MTYYEEATKPTVFYEDIVFAHGDDAIEPLYILDVHGAEAALEYLAQWHMPGEHMVSDRVPWGDSDHTYERDSYIVSWNARLGYIGLARRTGE